MESGTSGTLPQGTIATDDKQACGGHTGKHPSQRQQVPGKHGQQGPAVQVIAQEAHISTGGDNRTMTRAVQLLRHLPEGHNEDSGRQLSQGFAAVRTVFVHLHHPLPVDMRGQGSTNLRGHEPRQHSPAQTV